MVSLISIGIKTNASMDNGDYGEIPSAYIDAKKIYDTFERVLENNFKKCASVCVKDITSIECKALISALSLSIEEEDIVIFFFSGHGAVNANGKLQLVFSDYFNDGKKGIILLEEIVMSLKKYKCPIFIILDCCHSGAGIAESIKDDYKLESSVSIMTSTGFAGTENIYEDGSVFTNAICMALTQVMDQEEQISIANISEYSQKYELHSKIVIGGGQHDIVLSRNARTEYPEDFSKIFVNKIKNENYEMREALWYSVGYLPIGIKIDLLSNYISSNQEGCMELSWRVRRAIGSVYEYGNNDKIDEYIMKLILSENWMDKCVGYICARKTKDEKITELMYNEIQSYNEDYPMDLVWLLALYLADRKASINIEVLLRSRLMKSAWGAIEIWKRYLNDYDLSKKLELFKKYTDVKTYKQLCVELHFRGILPSCEFLHDKIKKDITFIKDLYQCKTRGRIEASESNKWIFSILCGNWRDQVDLNNVFERKWKSTRDKKRLLNMMRYIPSTEIKMAVLDYLSRVSKEDSSQINVNDLIWALQDQHPWVIRSALPLFESKKGMVEKNIRRNIDMKVYPGVFDLVIELSKQGIDSFEYQIENINDLERELIKKATNRERNV